MFEVFREVQGSSSAAESPISTHFYPRRNFYDAVPLYEQALALLPEPREDWSAATWIYVAIGDAYFLAGDFQSAWKPFRAVIHCPEATANPFIRMRRGQVYYELGDEHMATQELAASYMLGDTDIFAEEDPKYAEFILPKLDPPEMAQPTHPTARRGVSRSLLPTAKPGSDPATCFRRSCVTC